MKNNKNSSLSNRVTVSTFWIFLFQIIDNILGLIRLLILARLLTPDDFGLVAIAWLILQTISAFTQTGIHQALIHKPNISNYLNTAWNYLLFRGLILYISIYFAAPFLASFFNTDQLITIIRVISITLVLEGLTNIGTIRFQKDLQFNKQFIYQISGNLVDFVVAITLALVTRDVWAIVYGTVANNISRLILSYYLSSYRPRFEFKWSLFKEMNNYGKWIASSNILQFIYSQGDDFFVGRILNTTSLGFYQLAYKISNLPATQITHLISSVMFPAYSQIQSDKVRISKIYFQVFQLVTFLSFFVGTIIILFSYDFTLLFLGEKWLPMVPAMQLLTVWGIIRSVGATTGPVWQAIGKPKTITKLQLIQVIILLVTIYPLTVYWNIWGTSLAVVISAIIPNIMALIILSRSISLSLKTIFFELLKPLIGVIAVSTVFIFMRYELIIVINITWFIFLALICTIIYIIYSFILHRSFKYSLYFNLVKLIKGTIKDGDNKILNKFENFLNSSI